MLDVAILAGGKGTRLYPISLNRPKVLCRLRQRPFITYLFDQLIAAGIDRAVLCTGFGAVQIESELGSSYKSLRLVYSCEPVPLGTGGALRHALPLFRSEEVFVLNGDSYCDFDLSVFIDSFKYENAKASLLLRPILPESRYGSVRLENKRILSFNEKKETQREHWMNAGVYMFHRTTIAEIPPGRPISLEHEIFPKMAGPELSGYAADFRFFDIGTPASYEAAQSFFETEKVLA